MAEKSRKSSAVEKCASTLHTRLKTKLRPSTPSYLAHWRLAPASPASTTIRRAASFPSFVAFATLGVVDKLFFRLDLGPRREVLEVQRPQCRQRIYRGVLPPVLGLKFGFGRARAFLFLPASVVHRALPRHGRWGVVLADAEVEVADVIGGRIGDVAAVGTATVGNGGGHAVHIIDSPPKKRSIGSASR